MAKTATRGRRKAPARGKSKARSGGGGLLPWMVIGVAAFAGIAAYDNWKSIKPMLSKQPAVAMRESAETKPAIRRDAPPKQVALAAQAPKVTPPAQPLPPAAIPTPTAQPVKATPSASSPATPQTGAGAFGYCGQGAHINCVGDGGVFWYKGEKIVIADMESPVADRARCDDERRVAFAAKLRLLSLLNAGPFTMNAAGKTDPAGAPRVVSRDGRSFGVQLINEGLAHKPGAAGGAWCAA
ncbi:UNVERIFIED_ORG: endonuclease YncB(thermonuclease family) [Rhizobium etli]